MELNMTPPLSLTDAQLQMLTRAATLVADRGSFLRSIGNRLAHMSNPTDFEVQDAVNFVLSARGVAVGLQSNRIPRERKRGKRRRRLLQDRITIARFT
jgi:hypothetical protein